MSEAAVNHYLGEYERFRDTLASSWPAPRRADALEYLKTHGFPTRRTEQWKYTDVTPITRRKFSLPDDSDAAAVDEALLEKLRFARLDCYELVFINGGFSAALSRKPDLPPGAMAKVTVSSLQALQQGKCGGQSKIADAILTLTPGGPGEREGRDESAELPDIYFGDEEIGHAFTALNTAFLNDGVLVHVPDGMELSAPVHIIHLGGRERQDEDQAPPMSHPRNLIALGRGAGASVIETYIGIPDSEYFTNTHTSILAGAGARLDYYKIQQESRNAYHIGKTRISQQADSRVDCHALSLGGKLARWDIDAELLEPGAEINLNGLYLTDNRQHIDNHTLVEHKQPHTTSNERYRGIMNGRSRAVFNGKVIVHEQAQKTEAHQSNANLLLSAEAEVDAKPELEIYADDVKCSHGATVGRLDDNMLFYLRSRAVDEDTARSLLTYVFADEIVRDIKLPEIRERLEQGIAGELPDTDLIREFMQ